ncbi:MAG TPA: hypothetical protein VLA41_11345 [Burkholderiales bacterium]|nr:hypothetical protein [Burkholderiales bacterium]
MTTEFEELDYCRTPLGELVLRRRRDPVLGGEPLLEVKLGDDFLMSSRFTAGEVALAEHGLAAVRAAHPDVVVGGLGLGYTAAAVLGKPSVRSLLVIELLAPVLGWHRKGLVPLGGQLCADPRCRLLQGDFFALAGAAQGGLDPEDAARRFDAVLLDVDHSPRHVLDARRGPFYAPAGLRAASRHLNPGGVFALWSNEPPDAEFESALAQVFVSSQTHVVHFDNPYTGYEAANTIYVARATS